MIVLELIVKTLKGEGLLEGVKGWGISFAMFASGDCLNTNVNQ